MRIFTSVYLLLLAYIIAALVFWGISLQNQSSQIFYQETTILRTQIDSARNPQTFTERVSDLNDKRRMRTSQYLGEGTTFLLVILIGAAVVYTSILRSLRLSKQQNNFMLAVTHELKSPLAAVKLNLQTLEKHQLDEDKRKQLIGRSITEANRLNDLCNNLLFATQIEGGRYVPAREEFDLSVLVENYVDEYAARYPKRFVEDIIPDIRLAGDKIMLQMAVSNLFENAIKYSPVATLITIQLSTKQNTAVLEVIDQGDGIPDDEKKKVFNKFYRIGNEASRKTKGTGLGLYLTDKIIKQHKGKIIVKDNKPKGSVFEVCLPLA